MSIIETHCHLDYLKELTTEEIIKKSLEQNVRKIITISVQPTNFDKVIEIANKHANVYCSQGVHPHHAKEFSPKHIDHIKSNLASYSKVVAIGEIGLDYHYDNSPREIQREVFKTFLDLAIETDLPVIIHSRDADEDTIAILEDYAPKMNKKGVIHSFTSGQALADKALELGFHLGFNGIITFKSAQAVRDILNKTPLNRILVETDSPFLTPVPHRGKENAPYYLPHIISRIAEEKSETEDKVMAQTTENAEKLFNLI